MPTQLALRFDEVPVTCPTQERYHVIAPILSGRISPTEQAQNLNIGYSTITRWLREFRENGMRGLFSATEYPREPYTPDRVIVALLYFKCCAPKASDRELARVVSETTGQQLRHETVKALLQRYFFWKHPEFQTHIQYPIPADPQLQRLEMVKLHKEGWSEKSIASLLRRTPKTINKWLRRYKQEQATPSQSPPQQWLLDRSHAPVNPQRKVYFGTIHSILTLQKNTVTQDGSGSKDIWRRNMESI